MFHPDHPYFKKLRCKLNATIGWVLANRKRRFK